MQHSPFDYSQLQQAHRIVIKIGTNVMMTHIAHAIEADKKNNSNDMGMSEYPHFMYSMLSQIAQLKQEGKQFVLVSSGSIGFGAKELALSPPIKDIVLRQVCAATGQPLLMDVYRYAARQFNLNCAQVLITRNDFNSVYSYTSIKNCIEALLQRGILPIINENDTVSTEEIDDGFGDNDRLSAMIASKLKADVLIILTDVDAYYTNNPRKDPLATRIPVVYNAKELLANTELSMHNNNAETGTNYGTGGMLTKLKAATITQAAGCILCIGSAFQRDILLHFLAGKGKAKDTGTVFPALESV